MKLGALGCGLCSALLAGCAVGEGGLDPGEAVQGLAATGDLAARFAPVVYFDQVVPGDSGAQ